MEKYMLSGPGISARSDQPDSLIVILHGYGASGDNIIDLGHAWAKYLPQTEFIAPDGLQACGMIPGGYQWFSMGDWTPQTMRREAEKTAPQVHQAIQQALTSRNLNSDRLILVGFSQGAMMALMLGLEYFDNCAGIIGYSGACLIGDVAPKYHPPVFIVHGARDQVVPVSAAHQTEAYLQKQGMQVSKHICDDLDHSIDQQGLLVGSRFIKQSLSLLA